MKVLVTGGGGFLGSAICRQLLERGDQVIAYKASPKIYKRLQRLEMLEEALADVRKYVVVADEDDRQVYIVDLKEKLEPSLYDLDMGELPK